MKRRHEYSQHFLRDPALVKELIGHSSIKKTDVVLDIGAGSGIITSALASRAQQVIAVENEPTTIAKLQQNTARFPNVTIINADIVSMTLPANDYKVFANIPFHVSAAIVRKLTRSDTPPQDIYLIVQKQFAKKVLMSPHHFTAMLGAQIAPWFDCTIRRPLKRTDFWPHPNVDTVLLRISARTAASLPLSHKPQYWTFIERCFHDQVYFSTPAIQAHLTRKKRPSELSLDEWLTIYASVHPVAKHA